MACSDTPSPSTPELAYLIRKQHRRAIQVPDYDSNPAWLQAQCRTSMRRDATVAAILRAKLMAMPAEDRLAASAQLMTDTRREVNAHVS